MLAFLPSFAFFALAPLSVSLALWLAFSAAFAVTIRAFGAFRSLRIFDVSGLVLFGALAFYAGFIDSDFGPAEAGLVVECALLAVILWSMASHQPFIARYHWLTSRLDPPVVARAHTLIAAVWASCYALMAAISAVSVVLHRLAPGWASVVGLLVFAAMLTFTWQLGAYIDRHGWNIPFPRRR